MPECARPSYYHRLRQ